MDFKFEGQDNIGHLHQEILKKGISDSLFIFGKWTEKGQTETHLNYLGQVTTTNGRVLKIMNACFIWGLAKRATNRILVFDGSNRYIGNYYLTTTEDLPDKLENGFLIFTNSDSQTCDIKLITRINFTKGLPKEFRLKCKGLYSDTYSFSVE